MELSPALLSLREEAKKGRDPTCADETLSRILALCKELSPTRILEIGAAEGLTACAMLSVCGARYTGIELDPDRAARARQNFIRFAFSERATRAKFCPCFAGSTNLFFWTDPRRSICAICPSASGS